jgi:hypothetical protein
MTTMSDALDTLYSHIASLEERRERLASMHRVFPYDRRITEQLQLVRMRIAAEEAEQERLEDQAAA